MIKNLKQCHRPAVKKDSEPTGFVRL
jgi:hypothetical protein